METRVFCARQRRIHINYGALSFPHTRKNVLQVAYLILTNTQFRQSLPMRRAILTKSASKSSVFRRMRCSNARLFHSGEFAWLGHRSKHITVRWTQMLSMFFPIAKRITTVYSMYIRKICSLLVIQGSSQDFQTLTAVAVLLATTDVWRSMEPIF